MSEVRGSYRNTLLIPASGWECIRNVFSEFLSSQSLQPALESDMADDPRSLCDIPDQNCPLCNFQAATRNPYRHLQDHLARHHFKEKIAASLPTRRPFICPVPSCNDRTFKDWQAVMRHYLGKKHGILDQFVKDELSQHDFVRNTSI